MVDNESLSNPNLEESDSPEANVEVETPIRLTEEQLTYLTGVLKPIITDIIEQKMGQIYEQQTQRIDNLSKYCESIVSKANADMQIALQECLDNCQSKNDELTSSLLMFSENIANTIETNHEKVTSIYEKLLSTVNSLIALIKEYVVELKVTANVYLSSSKELADVLEQSSDLVTTLEKSYSQFASLVETIQTKTDKCNDSVVKLQSAIINILESIKFNAEALDATKMITAITQSVKNVKDTIIGAPEQRRL